MSLLAICQRCGKSKVDWTVHRVELHVGEIQHWHVMLCEDCTKKVEAAIREALPPTGGTA